MTHFYQQISSPVGQLTLIANADSLCGLLWENFDIAESPSTKLEESSTHPILSATKSQLEEYFAGKRKQFDLPLQMKGTDFQIKVWKGLQQIPYGETRSYAELAHAVGSPRASRAVGSANGSNPISIIVPCHRVIGADGTLGGFGGGLENKAFLLSLEQCTQ